MKTPNHPPACRCRELLPYFTDVHRTLFEQVKQQQAAHAEDRKAMLEIIQSKGEELLRREEEGKTMRLLYESEVG